MIEIDGSYGEGGGAILRQALGLSAFAGRSIRVSRIRAGRESPGLKPQHVKAVEAVAAVCGARVQGAALGSMELTFEPGPIRSGRFTWDIGTAGSITLLLQTLLVPCLCGDGTFEVEVVGGTDVRWSPPADYLSQVTFPALRPFGTARLTVLRRGYYPRGGGRLSVHLAGGRSTAPIDAVRPGRIARVRGLSHASSPLAERRVAERQAESARSELSAVLDVPGEIEVDYGDAYGIGSGVTLWTESPDGLRLGGSALGARGKPAEAVGREAAAALLSEVRSGAAVDRYLGDQLVPFLAVAGGALTTSEITLHSRSNIYVAERILAARFHVEGTRVAAEPVSGLTGPGRPAP